MTRTIPLRLMILHLSQMLLTDERTFMVLPSVEIGLLTDRCGAA